MKKLNEKIKYNKKGIDKIEKLCRAINAEYTRDGDFGIIIYQQPYNYTDTPSILFRIRTDMCMSSAGLFNFSSDTLDIKSCWLNIRDIKKIILGVFS